MVQYRSGNVAPIEEQEIKSVSHAFVVGVDIGGTNLRLALAAMDGSIVDRWAASTVGIREPHRIVQMICEGVDALLEKSSATRGDLRAMAAGAPGITDTDRGIVIATSYLMGWKDIPLRALLEAELGVPAFVDNDVNMAALGEHAAGVAKDVESFVFLAIGTGVGAGIVLKGELFRGDEWIAGEIGYMLVPGASTAPVESRQPGALEEIVGGEGIRSHWKKIWSEHGATLPQDATATQIFDRAQEHDPLARAVLGLASRTLAYAIYNLSLVLNCPLFVLGGGIGMHPAFGEAVREVVCSLNPRVQPSVLASSLGTEAQLTGAVFQAIRIAKTADSSVAIEREALTGLASSD
ncbi:MAG TPA: ROK family protein [Acidobacteriaceae bacterium]|jgi:glucokinase|nr:ROK family protein [Acidobacteriaceae bacterium]